MTGFVDIHSHVLYGLDDGAKTRDDSVAMLEMAARTGTTDIVATPHANGRYPFEPGTMAARIADLGAASTVRIYPGCDFRLGTANLDDVCANPRKYTINHTSYLLVEVPEVGGTEETGATLDRLLRAGTVPIVSHPERHDLLRQRVNDLRRWMRAGCYLQVTAGSYLGRFGRRAKAAAMELTAQGLVHFVASDAHDLTTRSPSLREAYALLARKWDEASIRPLFVNNPRAVVDGRAIEYEFGAQAAKGRRKWYRLWG